MIIHEWRVARCKMFSDVETHRITWPQIRPVGRELSKQSDPYIRPMSTAGS